MVKAGAQAKAAAVILPCSPRKSEPCTSADATSHVNSVPRGASKAEYHAATGLEAVFGYLHLAGEDERARELFDARAPAPGTPGKIS